MNKLSNLLVSWLAVTVFCGTTTTTAAAWTTPEKSHAPQSSTRRQFVSSSMILPAVTILTTAINPTNAMTNTAKIQYGEETIMAPKAYGTSPTPVQDNLLYGVPSKLADRICNYNRHFAESAGYFTQTDLERTVLNQPQPVTFYDSNTGKPLFKAPVHRTAEEFLQESKIHGWPSFRDDEVVWENVRVLKGSGETVSVDGTHLGHNLPDKRGNRYCINLVCIAGRPTN